MFLVFTFWRSLGQHFWALLPFSVQAGVRPRYLFANFAPKRPELICVRRQCKDQTCPWRALCRCRKLAYRLFKNLKYVSQFRVFNILPGNFLQKHCAPMRTEKKFGEIALLASLLLRAGVVARGSSQGKLVWHRFAAFSSLPTDVSFPLPYFSCWGLVKVVVLWRQSYIIIPFNCVTWTWTCQVSKKAPLSLALRASIVLRYKSWAMLTHDSGKQCTRCTCFKHIILRTTERTWCCMINVVKESFHQSNPHTLFMLFDPHFKMVLVIAATVSAPPCNIQRFQWHDLHPGWSYKKRHYKKRAGDFQSFLSFRKPKSKKRNTPRGG